MKLIIIELGGGFGVLDPTKTQPNTTCISYYILEALKLVSTKHYTLTQHYSPNPKGLNSVSHTVSLSSSKP